MHDVVAHEQREGRQQRLPHRLLHQVGEQHDERTALEAGEGLGEGAAVVALGQRRLEVEHRLGDPAELVAARAGGEHGAHGAVEGDEPAPVAEPGGDRGQAHERVHGVLDAGDVGHLARHDPTVVEQQEHVLVPLGAVGAHHRLAGAGGGGPVDPAHLVVDAVLAQLVELGAAAATLGRPEPDLEDPGPVDAELRLLAAGERRVDAEEVGALDAALPRADAERPLHPHHEVPDHEAAAPARVQRGRRAQRGPAGDGAAHASGAGPQRRRQVVGQRDADRAVGRVADRPRQLASRPAARARAGASGRSRGGTGRPPGRRPTSTTTSRTRLVTSRTRNSPSPGTARTTSASTAADRGACGGSAPGSSRARAPSPGRRRARRRRWRPRAPPRAAAAHGGAAPAWRSPSPRRA